MCSCIEGYWVLAVKDAEAPPASQKAYAGFRISWGFARAYPWLLAWVVLNTPPPPSSHRVELSMCRVEGHIKRALWRYLLSPNLPQQRSG